LCNVALCSVALCRVVLADILYPVSSHQTAMNKKEYSETKQLILPPRQIHLQETVAMVVDLDTDEHTVHENFQHKTEISFPSCCFRGNFLGSQINRMPPQVH